MRKLIILLCVSALGIGTALYLRQSPEPLTPPKQVIAEDPRNSTLLIEGVSVRLVNGIAVAAQPNSATPITTRYFGNEAQGDLTFDGIDDTAFLITQERGGSGVFFYAVVIARRPSGSTTTNAFFVGDRIAPQPMCIVSNELHVNYAERRPGEPMTARPSQGATLLLKVTPENLLEGLMR